MQFIQDNNIPQSKTNPSTKIEKHTKYAIQQFKTIINSKRN